MHITRGQAAVYVRHGTTTNITGEEGGLSSSVNVSGTKAGRRATKAGESVSVDLGGVGR